VTPRHDAWERRALILILFIAAALRGLDWNDPWHWGASPDPVGAGFKNVFGAAATGHLVRNFYEDGFTDSGFMPYYYRLQLPNGDRVENWYSHHPTGWTILGTTLMRIFGPHEWTLRMPSAIAALLSIWLAWRLLRKVAGPSEALFAAAAMAVMPLSAHYGSQAWNDPARICFNLALLHRYLLWLRSDDTRHLWWGSLWAFAGGLLDWAAHFVLIGVAIHVACVARSRGSFTPLWKSLILPAGAVVAIGLHYVHMIAVVPEEFRDRDTADTLHSILTPPTGFLGWFGCQGAHLWKLLTPVGCVLLVVGLLDEGRRLRRGEVSLERGIAYVSMAGLLIVIVFPGRSWNHEFFHHMAIAWFAFMIAVGGFAIARRLAPARIGGAATVVMLALAAWSITTDVSMWQRYRGTELVETTRAPWLAPILSSRRNVILTDSARVEMMAFYASARIVLVPTPRLLDDLERGGLRHDPSATVYFIADQESRYLPDQVHVGFRGLPHTRHGPFTVIPLSAR